MVRGTRGSRAGPGEARQRNFAHGRQPGPLTFFFFRSVVHPKVTNGFLRFFVTHPECSN